MGVVHEAQHLLIGRRVALKTIAAHSVLSSAAIERFRREAQATTTMTSLARELVRAKCRPVRARLRPLEQAEFCD
jgi:hypothetical protein